MSLSQTQVCIEVVCLDRLSFSLAWLVSMALGLWRDFANTSFNYISDLNQSDAIVSPSGINN